MSRKTVSSCQTRSFVLHMPLKISLCMFILASSLNNHLLTSKNAAFWLLRIPKPVNKRKCVGFISWWWTWTLGSGSCTRPRNTSQEWFGLLTRSFMQFYTIRLPSCPTCSEDRVSSHDSLEFTTQGRGLQWVERHCHPHQHTYSRSSTFQWCNSVGTQNQIDFNRPQCSIQTLSTTISSLPLLCHDDQQIPRSDIQCCWCQPLTSCFHSQTVMHCLIKGTSFFIIKMSSGWQRKRRQDQKYCVQRSRHLIIFSQSTDMCLCVSFLLTASLTLIVFADVLQQWLMFLALSCTSFCALFFFALFLSPHQSLTLPIPFHLYVYAFPVLSLFGGFCFTIRISPFFSPLLTTPPIIKKFGIVWSYK